MTGHRQFQEHAIELAQRSVQEKSPKLFVGAVLVKDGEVLGEGFRGQPGVGDHAEFGILKTRDVETTRGATMYTTLEPCNIRGERKTPCARRLIDAGISRVYVGAVDPFVSVRGGGIKVLHGGRVEVCFFDLDLIERLRAINAEFEDAHNKHDPAVHLAPRVRGFSNALTPAAACLEFLRLENVNAKWEEAAPLASPPHSR